MPHALINATLVGCEPLPLMRCKSCSWAPSGHCSLTAISRVVSQSADLLRRSNMIADDLACVPLEHNDHVDPTQLVDEELCHINAPQLVHADWLWF